MVIFVKIGGHTYEEGKCTGDWKFWSGKINSYQCCSGRGKGNKKAMDAVKNGQRYEVTENTIYLYK